MKWLVTVRTETDLQAFQAGLQSLGDAVGVGRQTPLADGEISIEVEAPADAKTRIRQLPGVTGVFPSSELTLYDAKTGNPDH